MGTIIFKNQHYTASKHDCGLIVQNNKSGKGINIPNENAKPWIGAIETALDNNEANALCRAFLRG